jgi:tellurite resistance protein TehA-like permease
VELLISIKLCFYVVKKANKLNHTHEKIFIPFIAIAIATLSSCNGEKRSDR